MIMQRSRNRVLSCDNHKNVPLAGFMRACQTPACCLDPASSYLYWDSAFAAQLLLLEESEL